MQVYVFGGSALSPLDRFERLDLASCVWENLTNSANSTPSPRAYHAFALHSDGKLYSYGGENLGNSYFVSYDPENNAWTDLTLVHQGDKPPSLLVGGGIVSSNGKLYLFGGYTSSSNPTNLFYSFNPDTFTWKYLTTGTTPTPRGLPGMA